MVRYSHQITKQLRYLDLIYPKIPYLDIDYLRPDPPYRVKFTK